MGNIVGKFRNPNSRDRYGKTKLHRAVKLGNLEKVRELLAGGVDVNIQDGNGDTALHCAAEEGNLEIVRELLPRVSDVNIQDNNGDTALHCAAENEHPEIVKELLEYKSNPNSRNKGGETSLHYAAIQDNVETVEELLKHGADHILQDNDGYTALHNAAIGNRVGIVKKLLEYGVDPNLQDNDGYTALHYAAIQECVETVEELLKHGADHSLQDKDGKTALDHNLIYKYEEDDLRIAKMLIIAGSKIPEDMWGDLRRFINNPEEMLKQGKEHFKELKENLCQMLKDSSLPRTQNCVEQIYGNISNDPSCQFKDMITVRNDFAKIIRRLYGLKFINTHPLSRLVTQSVSKLNALAGEFNERLIKFKEENNITEDNYPKNLKELENETIVRLNKLKDLLQGSSFMYKFAPTHTCLNFHNLVEKESKSREKITQEVQDEFASAPDPKLESETDPEKKEEIKKLVKERMEQAVDYKVKTDLTPHFEKQYYKGLSPDGVNLAKTLEEEWEKNHPKETQYIQWSYKRDTFKKINMIKAEKRLNKWTEKVKEEARKKFKEFFEVLEKRYKPADRTL